MNTLISKSRAFYNAKFGRCTICMQQSLAASLVAWSAFGIGLLMWPDHLAPYLVGGLAFGLSALWMAHVTAYAARTMTKARNGDKQTRAPRMTGALSTRTGLDPLERRRALGVFARAACVGVAASVPAVLWPSEVLAFCGQCTVNRDCGSDDSGWCCKNTAPVNAGYVCNECKKC